MTLTRSTRACLLVPVATALLEASIGAHSQAARGAAADPAAAILAAHKSSDASYAKAVLSPFTAVAVQYFQPGQTIRLAVGPAGPAFGPSAAGTTQVDLTLEDGAFAVAPVSGASARVASSAGEGGVSGLPGTPVTGRTAARSRARSWRWGATSSSS